MKKIIGNKFLTSSDTPKSLLRFESVSTPVTRYGTCFSRQEVVEKFKIVYKPDNFADITDIVTSLSEAFTQWCKKKY